MSRDRRVVISHQLNADGDPADIRFPVPHASPGVIGLISPIQRAVGAAIPGNHVVSMSAAGSATGGQPFSFGYDPKGRIEGQFRSMDNNIACLRPSDFFESGVQLPAVVHNGALEFGKICFGGSGRYGWYKEK